MNRKKLWLLFVATCVSSSSWALPEFVGSQSLAQGQSLTGASQLNDSLFANPASSAFTQVYTVDGAYEFPRNFAVSVLDTRTSAVGGALGYFRTDPLDTGEFIQGVKLGAVSRGHSNLAIGATGKMLWGPPIDGKSTTLTDADVGLLYNMDMLQFGVAFRNLFGGQALFQQVREWTFGLRFKWEDVIFLSASTYSTWEYFEPYQYGLGFEYVSPYYFSLKAGFRMQPNAQLSYWSGGLSFVTDKISFHYSVEFPNQANESITHMLGTTLMF